MIPDESKTKQQLLNELKELRHAIADLEVLERQSKRAGETPKTYQNMVESAQDAVFFKDLESRYIVVNDKTLEAFGLPRDEVIGKNDYEIMPQQEEAKQNIEDDQLVFKTGKIGEIIKHMKGADGREYWFHAIKVPQFDNKGSITGLVGIARDITERKLVEEELRESEEKYRALFESIQDGAFVIDAEKMKIVLANQAAMKMYGFDSVEDAVGVNLLDFISLDDREPFTRIIAENMFAKNLRQVNEFRTITKGGKEIWVSAIGARIEYQGRLAGLVSFRDITERKKADEREKKLQQELYLCSRLASIGELAAGVAHEINNPLTGILGLSQRLLRKSNDEKVKQDLERIHSEAQRAAKVVQNLLTFARRHESKKEYLDINDILQKTLELRAYELKTSNIEVVLDLAPVLPKTIADFQQIEEIFLNIILNAEQAMTEVNRMGKLVIKTQDIKDYIKISFTDNGPGIPAEQMDRLFDPFFTTRGERGGTGLGLSICHGIVVDHGGRIYVRSKPGKGATFVVELPVISMGSAQSNA